VAKKFVGAVRAEAKRAAQEKLRNWAGVAIAESCSALRCHKYRSGRSDGLEKLNLPFHRGKPIGCSGTGVIPAKSSLRSVAASRNHRVIGMVHKEMQFCVSGAPGDG